MVGDEMFMQEALQLAALAEQKGEVPVGAVLVKDNKIIASGYNQVISKTDPSAHAEIVVLREAAKIVGNYRLLDTTLYTTLEPCCMCASAAVHARVKTIVFGTFDKKSGACGSVFNLVKGFPLNHRIVLRNGVLEDSCKEILTGFFKKKR